MKNDNILIAEYDSLISPYRDINGGVFDYLSKDTLFISDSLKSSMVLELTNHTVNKYWLLNTYSTDMSIPYNLDWAYTATEQVVETVFDSSLESLIQKLIADTTITHIVIRTTHNNLIAFKIEYEIWIGPALSVSEEVLEVTNTRVYPNPVINNLTVEFETTNSSTELEVYSTNGQLMFKDNDYRGFGKNTVSVDMSNYQEGMYFVRLGNEIKKVIKR